MELSSISTLTAGAREAGCAIPSGRVPSTELDALPTSGDPELATPPAPSRSRALPGPRPVPAGGLDPAAALSPPLPPLPPGWSS
eukprot:scaffold1554_cov108-Isochrysis_galbana.AAC.3